MKFLNIFSVCLLFSIVCLAQTNDALQFKARIGFNDEKEHIVSKNYSADGTKLTLIGLKTIQTWDVPTAELIESHSHEIVELDKFNGTAYEFSPDGSKVVTLDSIGRDGDKKEDRVNAYAYDVKTGKRIAVLERPETSVRFAFWSDNGATLVTFSGIYLQKQTEISFWNGADLSFRKSINIEGYTWHYLSKDGERLYVGNGGRLKVLGISVYGADEAEAIRVFNTRTGAVEKTLDAGGEGFEVERGYTFASPDGRFIAAAKNKNVIVWDTGGKSQPIYELTAPNGKNRMRLEGFSDDGKYLFIRQDGVDEYYDTATGQLVNDAPQLVKLRRENEYFIPNVYADLLSLVGDRYRREDSVQQTPDGRYAVVTPCEKATILDLMTGQTLYTVKSECHGGGEGNYRYDTDLKNYFYSYDVFRLSPSGKLLINFRYDQFVVRDLKTGTVLQRIVRKQDKNLINVPKWNTEWDIKGRYALTTAEDEKSILIWEINEN